MTRISLLQEQRDNFAAQVQQLDDKWEDIYIAEQRAVNAMLTQCFTGLAQDVEIEVVRGSVYFKMPHPNYSYNKELFSLYLRENWRDEGQKYSGMDVSYYTTSTKAEDAWEMKRLQLLGKVAEIVERCHSDILTAANNVIAGFKDQYAPINAQLRILREGIRDIDERIAVLEKEKIAFDLKKDGVTFDSGMNIQLKYSYSPWIKSIKLTDFSKSGKKATAVFVLNHGNITYSEDNVSVQSIIDQVYGLRKNIVEKELLTSQ